MIIFEPEKIYYEKNIFSYKLGKRLYEKYKDISWIEIENHNNISKFRKSSNSDFSKLKKNLIIGVRKTHKFVPNYKTSDFLVPYTSSGCAASCLYCYLVCHYNKCSYLRVFVNREEMLEKIIKTSYKSEKELTFEIGSNSDLILENTVTENLPWTIKTFAKEGRGFLTFPTKFDMIEPLLDIDHKSKTIIRMSVNPEEIIKKIEFGTSTLLKRIDAINKLCDANYPVGILIAPIVMIENWKEHYEKLLQTLYENLSSKVKREMFIEVIFMTYSFIHKAINKEAFPKAIELYDKDLMTGRGRGKYSYKNLLKNEGAKFLRNEINKYFPNTKIEYIV
ncbi:MAG: Spore photoproduct lyase [Eubacteriales bacterium SKADARSKE-1]|nr:Spore photoproduct lyase [Eubacteriales bacterium SKADARSKE-1]